VTNTTRYHLFPLLLFLEDTYRLLPNNTMPKRSSLSPDRSRNKRRKSLSNDESCAVFVGNLGYNTKWQALKDHMRRAGNVDSATILEDSQTRRSKGCGVVTFQDPRDATRAIRELNESTLDGRTIFVQPDKKPAGGSNNNYNGGDSNDNCVVHVGNLDWDCTWQNLKDKFKACGHIDKADIAMNPNGRSKGFGKITFSHPRDAQNAIRRFGGANFQGRILTVKPSGSSDGGGKDNNNDEGRGNGIHSLFVGNLDFDCRPRDLRNVFSRFGRIDNVEIAQNDGGKSKGIGFVDFNHRNDAQKALNQMDGSDFQGRRLKVKWDRESSGGGGGAPSAQDGPKDDGLPNTTIHIGNLDFQCRWQDLKDLCKVFGKVDHAEIAEHADTKRSKGYGTVKFLTTSQAQRAIEKLNGSEFKDRKVQVKWDKKKGAPGAGEYNGAEPKKKPKKEKPQPKKEKAERPALNLDAALSSGR